MNDEAASEDIESQETDDETGAEAPEEEVQPSENEVTDEAAGQLPASDYEPAFENSELNILVKRALQPVSETQPCGESEERAESVISRMETSSDVIFDSIQREFSEAVREGGSMAGFDTSYSGQAASELVEEVVDCLETGCKSVVMASYLPHLMMILHGLPGFSAGLEIVRELVSQYQNQVFPRDADKLKSYLISGVYVGNDDRVTNNFRLFLYCPITEKQRLPYALLRNSRIKGVNTDVDSRYNSDARESGVDFYVRLNGDLDQLIETARSANSVLGDFLDDRLCELVSFSFIESIERQKAICHNLAVENCEGYPPVEMEEQSTDVGGATNQPAPAAIGEIENREQAIKLLKKIAEFFHRTERHSPVSWSLRQTVKWSKMDLPDLLKELMHGEARSIEELARQVGFEVPQDEDDDE